MFTERTWWIIAVVGVGAAMFFLGRGTAPKKTTVATTTTTSGGK